MAISRSLFIPAEPSISFAALGRLVIARSHEIAAAQANADRREGIRARAEALRAILKLAIDSHVVWIDTDDHDA
ncbi:hypothetical protein EQZ23_04430 [Sphingomonas sp. UV9]|uniref:hypothetical protein n=1 Tax=Sphingomonas sp. UV9 TaxID=1851410 RepID=UPI000FFC208F|nr:hypothetical protein [Sphingomonas sp. UV9]RXD07306.1 hypothetical protein EQZ23_04430 [Sphingomonas sp. UV9]